MSDYNFSDFVGSPNLEKTPDEVIRVPFHWASRLDGETIVSDTFELPDGLTNVAEIDDGTERAIRVSGGDDGRTYRVENTIVTSGSRTLQQVKRVLVRDG